MTDFMLSIDLGNAAMRQRDQVAAALRAVADRLDAEADRGNDDRATSEGNIRDANGNTVGGWSVRWPA